MISASNTIDRHTPIIPLSIWQGLPPEEERTYTLIKNKILLPASGIKSPISNKKTIERTITDEHLRKAEAAIDSSGIKHLARLHERSLTDDEIRHYKFQDTETLVRKLDDDVVTNLTLRLPNDLPPPHNIDGVSIPVYSRGLFIGFATLVCNNPMVKYAFSIPNRFCFGDNTANNEVYVVEGVFDAIALRRSGLNAMGMGDSQPNYFKMWMASQYQKVNLLFDDDLGGALGCVKAYLILTKMLGKSESDIIIWGLTGGMDPEQAVLAGCMNFTKLSYNEMLEQVKKWHSFERAKRELL